MIDEIRLVVQLGVGLVFLLSAPGKSLNPGGFARAVKEYQILPETLAYGVGLSFIPLEIFVAVSHLTGWLLAFAVPLALAILASFATGVAVNLKRGRVLPCYCFGGRAGDMISGRTLSRLLLLFVGELLLLSDPRLFVTSQFIYPGRIASFGELGLVLSWVVFLLVAGFWLLSVTDMIELLRPCGTCGTRAPGPDSSSPQRSPRVTS